MGLMMKRGAVAAVLLSVAVLTDCSSPEVPEPVETTVSAAEATTAAPTPTPTPTPTETGAVKNGVPFGSTNDATFDQSKWQITVQEPKDITAELIAEDESYGLESNIPEGQVAYGVDGTIKRVSGGLADPGDEIHMGVIIDGQVKSRADTTTQPHDDLDDVPDLTDGATGEFRMIYFAPAGTPITSVLVLIGEGELSTGIVWGEYVEGA